MATCNGAKTLPKVLNAYEKLLSPAGGWSAIIVDDGSTDETGNIVASYASRLPIQYLHQERSGKNTALNRGVELALAQGGAEAKAQLFVMTDDDATPDPDWLVAMQACAGEHPDHDLFGGAIVPDWGAPPPDWILRNVPLGLAFAITTFNDGPIQPGAIWGPNMAVRRRVFDAGHRFDPNVGPNRGNYVMGSETEFNKRIVAAGHQAWFCNSARVHHFIRPHQLTEEFCLGRAFRGGRGSCLEAGSLAHYPTLFGVPRWLYTKKWRHALEIALATLRGDQEGKFKARFQYHHTRGFLHQAHASKDMAAPGAGNVRAVS
jgi:glycosyltransferase involved in cell wall biosynthesis